MIQSNNYITIQGFMVTELGLKGNELLVYALIYGFSQDGGSEFNGSLEYIGEWIGSDKSTARRTLKRLLDKDLLVKEDVEIANHLKLCKYRINGGVGKTPTPCANRTRGVGKTPTGHRQNAHGGVGKTPTNNNTNITNYKNNNKSAHEEKHGFKEHDYDFAELERVLLGQ